MLQQIIRDMYIDPDLLAELSEEQKQILFCKMREEQVRRYKLEQEKNAVVKQGIQRKAKVKFLLGKDNKPWTWVMGEHQEDETIEQILEKEQLEKARRLAQQEAEQRLVHVQVSSFLLCHCPGILGW
ncbi:SH2 domain-containing protein 4B-like, partial [Saccoglossus kowalevskii]|uniref:SH2 domain-containing protein 4B-like n=1 Tax=Saccoglossus kowalevskii TaxID=10224 RepID=A0ABM0M466_SACKO